MADAFERIAENADQFSRNLLLFADAIDGDLEQVIRKAVLKVFRSIVKRSPVDTGTYRASHGITTDEPGEEEGVVEVTRGGSEGTIIDRGVSWHWELGDGAIYIFNNVPYAEKLEDGHSKQAPQGIYALSLAEFNTFFEEALRGADRLR